MNYSEKESGYYANVRHDLLSLIPPSKKGVAVMEIGAAYGATLYYLKQSGIAAQAVGVELYEDVKNKENYKPLDRFIFADILQVDFPEYEGYFDIILLPDVLEHLTEPKEALAKVSRYLKPDGLILVSMPNIRHYTALKKIFLKGDFRYEESGIFDYTHMRFYCRKNIAELLTQSGFAINHCEGSVKNYRGRSGAKVFNTLTGGMFEEFLSVQYYFRAAKDKV